MLLPVQDGETTWWRNADVRVLVHASACKRYLEVKSLDTSPLSAEQVSEAVNHCGADAVAWLLDGEATPHALLTAAARPGEGTFVPTVVQPKRRKPDARRKANEDRPFEHGSPDRPVFVGASSKEPAYRMKNRYGSPCRSCGATIPIGTEMVWEPEKESGRSVSCLRCWNRPKRRR